MCMAGTDVWMVAMGRLQNYNNYMLLCVCFFFGGFFYKRGRIKTSKENIESLFFYSQSLLYCTSFHLPPAPCLPLSLSLSISLSLWRARARARVCVCVLGSGVLGGGGYGGKRVNNIIIVVNLVSPNCVFPFLSPSQHVVITFVGLPLFTVVSLYA